jgi:hypothetical protein
VRLPYVISVLILSTAVIAQSPPVSCPADRPIDDIVAEIHKQQSKKKNRNPSLVPEITCIGGWCRDHSRTPPTIPDPGPKVESPRDDRASVSARGVDDCDAAMEKVLEAAHDVDVGDYYFEINSYKAALLRYEDAAKQKAGDIAIHVRIGRAFEKLKQPKKAAEEYEVAQKLAGPQKWSDEAKSALARLRF